MSFRWLLLAFFLVALIWGTTKALKWGMKESLLRLGTVVAAFLITFLLAVFGLFRSIASAVAGAFDVSFGQESVKPLAVAFLATLIGAILFVLIFLLLSLLLRVVALRFVRKLLKMQRPSRRREKAFLYRESWVQRAASVASGAVSSFLLLGVLLLPLFYAMSFVTVTTNATEQLDAKDSRVYKTVEVLDTRLADPYEESFVYDIYDAVGISDLMCYTAKISGKMTLDDGTTAYADDVAKLVLSHGVRAAAQITSGESSCATVKEDVHALITDPVISDILTDIILNYINGIEMEEPAKEDLKGGIVHEFVKHYQAADPKDVKEELSDFGNAISLLAERHVLPRLLAENADFEQVIRDKDALDSIVEAISPLTAFGPTVESAFEMSVDIMGDTLKIPTDRHAAYDHFMDDLLTKMQRDTDVGFDINTIRYYIFNCVKQNKKVSSANGIKGHGQFMEYVAHWEKVQGAFATASEDQSYGYFTIEINSQWYVYDKSRKVILIYDEVKTPEYADKLSPVAGIINALTLRSTQDMMTREKLHAILAAYADAATDPVSVELATRMLSAEAFASRAVTVENMQGAVSFKDWTEEEKQKDGKLCVDIIINLMTLMDNLSADDSAEGEEKKSDTEAALDMLDEFALLGETMDTMRETSCLNGLPPLLIEGIIKNELFAGYMKPSTAFQINRIVENKNRTYTDCMLQIADVLRWAIHSFGDLSEVK